MQTNVALNRLVTLLNAGYYGEQGNQTGLLSDKHTASGVTWKGLGAALQNLGKNTLSTMQKAAELLPDNFEVHFNLGNALKELGHISEAEASYRQALKIKPNYAEALNNLGIILQKAGRLDEAVSCHLKALEVNPEYTESINNLGIAFFLQGRLDDAETSYRRALQISSDYAEAHYNLGIVLHLLGRLPEAEASYQKALQINPDNVEAHNNLGLTLQDLGRSNEAELSYQRALHISPCYAEALNNLGNAYLEMNRLDEAIAIFRQAIKIKPGLVDAHSNLGSALMDLGKLDEAEIFLNKAIELAPGDAKPLTTALLYIPYERDDPNFSQLEAIYSTRESLPVVERIKLNFAMGKAMENIGQYDRSFRAYEEGNFLHYQLHPFDEAAEDRFVENSCSIFTLDLFNESASQIEKLSIAQDKRVPIFIVGMLRSGSTLIEQILSSHPAIFGAGELNAFKSTLLLRESIAGEDDVLKLYKLGQKYLEQVWKLAPTECYITDKLPGNYCHLGLIHMMLPNAKIIHTMRDPIDTCFSCYSLRFTRGHEYSYDLGVLGRTYQRYMKMMQHWHNVLPPGRILDVRYEDCVADPEHEARRMLDYIGLPWDAACLKFHENKRAVRTASVTQVRKPIYSSSIARWKRFVKYLSPLIETIGQRHHRET